MLTNFQPFNNDFMTDKELIEDSVKKFISMVNTEKIVSLMKQHEDSLAEWVKKFIHTELPNYVIVSSILYALFERVNRDLGETISDADTARYNEEFEIKEIHGDILRVAFIHGHVWIEAQISYKPLASIEISNYDNVK